MVRHNRSASLLMVILEQYFETTRMFCRESKEFRYQCQIIRNRMDSSFLSATVSQHIQKKGSRSITCSMTLNLRSSAAFSTKAPPGMVLSLSNSPLNVFQRDVHWMTSIVISCFSSNLDTRLKQVSIELELSYAGEVKKINS